MKAHGQQPVFMGDLNDGLDRIEADFADFPFLQTLGLTSNPYFGWTEPEDLPLDDYTRLRNGRNTPVMVVEGGWASASAGGFVSAPAKQARQVTRHAALLDEARAAGWLQLACFDIDITSIPPPVPANLPLFTGIGFTDCDFAAKPALGVGDALFARRRI